MGLAYSAIEDLKSFEETLKKDYLCPSYLDQFHLNGQYPIPNISVVIPTYNRSPNPIEQNTNPLGWCFSSLLEQRGGRLAEIIIINDGSTDYTEELVRNFSEKSSIPIVYLKNQENKGLSISRNKGIRASKHNLIQFVDDDCILSRYMLFGADFTLNKLNDEVVALQLPIYHRKTTPRPIDIKDIGVLNLEVGVMDGNYDGFPKEYMQDLENNFLDPELKILKPFEIKNLGGIFMAKKEALTKIGGFPEFFTWRNAYRIETDISLRFSDKDYKMFFTPDPKFHSIHFKYGAVGETSKNGNLDKTLKHLIEQSNVPRSNTGCRVDIEEWFFDRIISDYVVLGMRDKDFAKKYKQEMYKRFVEDNELYMTGIGIRIDDSTKRRSIFEKAIKEGDKLIRR